MLRNSMPFVGSPEHAADLFFEVLDRESQGKVLQDLKDGARIKIPAFKGNPPTEIHSENIGQEWGFVKPFSPNRTVFKYDTDKKEYVFINKKAAARLVVQSFLKLAAYDRDKLIPGYKGRFVIHDHTAERAGRHFDLRLEFPVASLHQALNSYEGKRIPGTEEPIEKYPDEPGTVYRSFAVKKHTIPTGKAKLFIVETEDHPIEYGSFKGSISEGYGAGEVDIFDKGTFEILDVEGDKKYTLDFHGEELNGVYALVKYNQGYLWVKTKDATKTASIHDRPIIPSFFSQTNYRLPTEEELREINSFDLSAKELMEGFSYTIVGRGIMREQEKTNIIKSAKMLSSLYPENQEYKKAVNKAEEIKLFHQQKTSAGEKQEDSDEIIWYCPRCRAEWGDINRPCENCGHGNPYKTSSKSQLLGSFSRRIVESFREREARDYSCVMCPLPWKISEKIRQWGIDNIPDGDLIGDGREASIHVTVKYGLHNHDPFELRPLLQNYGPIEITLGKISLFENGKEDVIKIEVTSPRLVQLNSLITKHFENTETHPDYIPHITIAYVKSGAGKKYEGNGAFEGTKVILDKAEFSGNDYRETTFSMASY